MKEFEFEPEIEIIRFAFADIVTTSFQLDEDEVPPLVFG